MLASAHETLPSNPNTTRPRCERSSPHPRPHRLGPGRWESGPSPSPCFTNGTNPAAANHAPQAIGALESSRAFGPPSPAPGFPFDCEPLEPRHRFADQRWRHDIARGASGPRADSAPKYVDAARIEENTRTRPEPPLRQPVEVLLDATYPPKTQRRLGILRPLFPIAAQALRANGSLNHGRSLADSHYLAQTTISNLLLELRLARGRRARANSIDFVHRDP